MKGDCPVCSSTGTGGLSVSPSRKLGPRLKVKEYLRFRCKGSWSCSKRKCFWGWRASSWNRRQHLQGKGNGQVLASFHII